MNLIKYMYFFIENITILILRKVGIIIYIKTETQSVIITNKNINTFLYKMEILL